MCQLGRCPLNLHRVPRSCIVVKSSGIDPMFDELWSEIADAPGEIFDIPEMQELEEKFDVNEYLNGNYDY